MTVMDTAKILLLYRDRHTLRTELYSRMLVRIFSLLIII